MTRFSIKMLMLSAAFSAGFWLALDGHSKEFAVRQLRTAAPLLRETWSASSTKPRDNPQTADEAKALQDDEPATPPSPPVKGSPGPEGKYLDALRILEAGSGNQDTR